MLGNEGFYFFSSEGCEYLDVFDGFFITDIEPELIEGLVSGTLGIQPYIAAFRLTEFFAVRLGN